MTKMMLIIIGKANSMILTIESERIGVSGCPLRSCKMLYIYVSQFHETKFRHNIVFYI